MRFLGSGKAGACVNFMLTAFMCRRKSQRERQRTGSGREVLTCCRRRGARSHRGCGAIENNERMHCTLSHTQYTSRQNLFSRKKGWSIRERVAAAPRYKSRAQTRRADLLYMLMTRDLSAGPINRQTTTETRARIDLFPRVRDCYSRRALVFLFRPCLQAVRTKLMKKWARCFFRRRRVAPRALEGREDAPKKIVTKNWILYVCAERPSGAAVR